MATVDRNTLENNGLLFVRDVLRENLTDPLGTRSASDWIVKSPVKNENISLPMVVLDQSSVKDERVTFKDAVKTTLSIGLMIWANKIQNRDELNDAIKGILSNDLNTDGTNTMYSQGLTYNGSDSRNSDGYVQGFSELLRIKEMTVNLLFLK